MQYSPLPPNGFLDTCLAPEDFAMLSQCDAFPRVERVVPNALNGPDRGLTLSAFGTTRATTLNGVANLLARPSEQTESYNLI